MNSLNQNMQPNDYLGMVRDLKQQFARWRQTFNGDPKEAVMNMVQSGKLTQEQLDTAQQLAQQLQNLL